MVVQHVASFVVGNYGLSTGSVGGAVTAVDDAPATLGEIFPIAVHERSAGRLGAADGDGVLSPRRGQGGGVVAAAQTGRVPEVVEALLLVVVDIRGLLGGCTAPGKGHVGVRLLLGRQHGVVGVAQLATSGNLDGLEVLGQLELPEIGPPRTVCEVAFARFGVLDESRVDGIGLAQREGGVGAVGGDDDAVVGPGPGFQRFGGGEPNEGL
jgi:hypothetical protein